ncbi:hypothetical protein [Pararcticibacter amylolyticus]|uniref:Outer membrane protein beta-barrel domain-containing protein n=1 Tax=Pararcticibacter amylolyticus TaxID=2173175 RepID=A0A2U2PD22_9SPHI|nr:hypothetical protein [Pararcticibacter amylolyticus]PWG79252.1 hypothetical protein DDR33_18380 [Pararcticibacter amylolyticus]
MRFRLLFVLFLISSIQVIAQDDTTKKATVTLAGLYSSDVSYYGQSINVKLPYALFNATVRLPSGLHFSAGAYKLLNFGSGISETDLGAGYDFDFNDKIGIGASYSRSFFPSNSPLLQAANENNINLSATGSFSLLKSELSADYAFGQQSDLFLSLENSKEISLGSFLSDKNTFYIEPAIELVAGTRHFYNTYSAKKEKRNQGKGKGAGGQANSTATSTPVTIQSSSFNLLSYNFRLPLGFSRSDYLVEVGYQFSILGPKAEAELRQQQSLFDISFYYQF